MSVIAQITPQNILGSFNPIRTAVPFLTIGPDPRANAMGGCGVASSPDINSQHWNVAKYAFIDERGGVSLNYTPWLRAILPDINHAYLSGYYKPNQKQAISASLRFLSLGEVTMLSGEKLNPYDMAIDLGYSRQLSRNFFLGAVVRYIHSNPSGSSPLPGEDKKLGKSVAFDLGAFYSKDLESLPLPSILSFGAVLSNLGTPISYTEGAQKTAIPANLRLGTSFEISPRQNHALTCNLDFNKLLVWSGAIYEEDRLIRGMPPADNYFMGLIQSFYDAPGLVYDDGSISVFREELAEIIINFGLEYTFAGKWFFRGGYFHESVFKGGRQYFTLGAGLKLANFSVDLSYFIVNNNIVNPLKNTLSVGLSKSFPTISFN